MNSKNKKSKNLKNQKADSYTIRKVDNSRKTIEKYGWPEEVLTMVQKRLS